MWEINLSEQIYTFLLSLIVGSALCLFYDTLREAEKQIRMSKRAVFFVDVIFFALAGLFDFCFFLVRCNGDIRGFVFVGQFIGFVIFRAALSRFYGILLLVIFKLIKALKKIINKWIFTPAALFSTQIRSILVDFYKKLLKFMQKKVEKS